MFVSVQNNPYQANIFLLIAGFIHLSTQVPMKTTEIVIVIFVFSTRGISHWFFNLFFNDWREVWFSSLEFSNNQCTWNRNRVVIRRSWKIQHLHIRIQAKQMPTEINIRLFVSGGCFWIGFILQFLRTPKIIFSEFIEWIDPRKCTGWVWKFAFWNYIRQSCYESYRRLENFLMWDFPLPWTVIEY